MITTFVQCKNWQSWQLWGLHNYTKIPMRKFAQGFRWCQGFAPSGIFGLIRIVYWTAFSFSVGVKSQSNRPSATSTTSLSVWRCFISSKGCRVPQSYSAMRRPLAAARTVLPWLCMTLFMWGCFGGYFSVSFRRSWRGTGFRQLRGCRGSGLSHVWTAPCFRRQAHNRSFSR